VERRPYGLDGMAKLPEVGGVQLPEAEGVWWRPPMSEQRLRSRERIATAFTAVYVLPFLVIGVGLLFIKPLLFPVALWSFAHAWVIPELFAHRGARVVFPLEASGGERPERTALGLLGDMLDHAPRELMLDTGLALERGRLGVWILGEAGALLVRRSGWRTHCFCVRATDPELPRGDRIAHLLMALREDEIGFATVANHAFSGATWRVHRRLREGQRAALEAAIEAATEEPPTAPSRSKLQVPSAS
jgi:hypothetical protein